MDDCGGAATEFLVQQLRAKLHPPGDTQGDGGPQVEENASAPSHSPVSSPEAHTSDRELLEATSTSHSPLPRGVTLVDIQHAHSHLGAPAGGTPLFHSLDERLVRSGVLRTINSTPPPPVNLLRAPSIASSRGQAVGLQGVSIRGVSPPHATPPHPQDTRFSGGRRVGVGSPPPTPSTGTPSPKGSKLQQRPHSAHAGRWRHSSHRNVVCGAGGRGGASGTGVVSIPRPASAGAIFHAQQHRPPLRSVDPLDVTEAVRGWEGEGGLESPVVGGEDEEAAMRVRQEALDRYLAHSPTRMLRDGGAAGPPAAESESCALSATPCCPERARFFKELKEKERRYLRRKETGVLSSEEASLLDGSARFDPQGYTVITNEFGRSLSPFNSSSMDLSFCSGGENVQEDDGLGSDHGSSHTESSSVARESPRSCSTIESGSGEENARRGEEDTNNVTPPAAASSPLPDEDPEVAMVTDLPGCSIAESGHTEHMTLQRLHVYMSSGGNDAHQQRHRRSAAGSRPVSPFMPYRSPAVGTGDPHPRGHSPPRPRSPPRGQGSRSLSLMPHRIPLHPHQVEIKDRDPLSSPDRLRQSRLAHLMALQTAVQEQRSQPAREKLQKSLEAIESIGRKFQLDRKSEDSVSRYAVLKPDHFGNRNITLETLMQRRAKSPLGGRGPATKAPKTLSVLNVGVESLTGFSEPKRRPSSAPRIRMPRSVESSLEGDGATSSSSEILVDMLSPYKPFPQRTRPFSAYHGPGTMFQHSRNAPLESP